MQPNVNVFNPAEEPFIATIARTRVRVSSVERLDRFLRSQALRLVLFFLVANTILAQAFFNSAGRILVLAGHDVTALYLNVSAIFSTLAFSLFEIAMLWARQEVLALDDSIKQQIGARAWLRRNLWTLVVISAINFYSLTVFNAAIWPDIHVPGIPEPPAPWKYYLHAGFYTVILYLAGIVGERVKTEQELTMSLARKHTQQALAAHDAQFSQQIKDMTAHGDPLAPLAAATSSPETAQLIALQAIALSGQLSVADAARLNLATRGHETELLDRLLEHTGQIKLAPAPWRASGTRDVMPLPARGGDIGISRAELEADPHSDGSALPTISELPQMPRQRYSSRRVTERLEATQ